jgi:hypothetical protein
MQHTLNIKRVLDSPVNPADLCTILMGIKYTDDQRIKLQSVIHSEMVHRLGINFTTIKDSDIDYLFRRIDHLFCGGSLQKLNPPPVAQLMEPGYRSKSPMTLGDYITRTNTIRINTPLWLSSRSEEVCNGVVCKSRISVLQSVVEHEMVHMIVNNSCWEKLSHGKNFVIIAKKIFGHTHYRHALGRDVSVIDGRAAVKTDFRVGEEIHFQSKTGIVYGTISKLNRVNAVVLSGTIKYNVPFQLILKN